MQSPITLSNIEVANDWNGETNVKRWTRTHQRNRITMNVISNSSCCQRHYNVSAASRRSRWVSRRRRRRRADTGQLTLNCALKCHQKLLQSHHRRLPTHTHALTSSSYDDTHRNSSWQQPWPQLFERKSLPPRIDRTNLQWSQISGSDQSECSTVMLTLL